MTLAVSISETMQAADAPLVRDASAIDRAWSRYVAAAARVYAAVPNYVRQGAARRELERVERVLRCELPHDVRRLLELTNGSAERQILPGWELFSARRVVNDWRAMRRTWRGARKESLSQLVAIPIGGDGVGNYLCVLSGKAARQGEVVIVWQDETTLERVATSLCAYFNNLVSAIERGEIGWDEDWGGMYRRPLDAEDAEALA